MKELSQKEYEELLSGKTVAIVGPAAYLKGSGVGKEIDSYDFVVRFNKYTDIKDIFPNEDYGDRCDILYSCMSRKEDSAGSLDISNLEKCQVKILCSSFPKLHSEDVISGITHILKDGRDKSIGIKYCDPNWFDIAKETKVKYPHTGFYAILDIVSCNPFMIKIFGMTFYQGDRLYREGYHKRKDAEELTKSELSGHQIDQEFAYIQKLVKDNKIIYEFRS